MISLDDLARFDQVDAGGLRRHLDALPDQLEAGWAQGQALPLPATDRPLRQVLIVGHGDSRLAGDLARTVAHRTAPGPLMLWPEAGLPPWAGAETLVLALSHSGNTGAVVAAAEAALARGAPVLAITSGGRLAARPGLTAWTYPPAGDSRTALGAQAALALAALARLGWAPDLGPAVAEAGHALRVQQTSLRAESPVMANPAKRMAGQLMDRYAVLFVDDDLAPAGRRWQSQINQLAKAWAQCLPLAEADHAMAGTLFPERLIDKYMTLWLRNPASPQADEVRLHFMTSGFNTDAILARGEGHLARLFTLLHYGDYTAYYLAMAYGIDPGEG